MQPQKVAQGPGQPEVIGDLANPRMPNPPGTYKDPESGVVQTVTHAAGADALVRMGFKLVEEGPAPKTIDEVFPVADPEPEEQSKEEEPVAAPEAPAPAKEAAPVSKSKK